MAIAMAVNFGTQPMPLQKAIQRDKKTVSYQIKQII
jgi:hypothetical protein